MKCAAIMSKASKRAGEVCGASIVGFVAPGAGRCGWHYHHSERVRALAQRRAIRDARELRGLEPDEREAEHQGETCADQEPESGIRFDAERFAGAELDE